MHSAVKSGSARLGWLIRLGFCAVVLAGCDGNDPNKTPSPTVSGSNLTEGAVKGKGAKGGEAKPTKNNDIHDLIPKKER
jgi:hypothetical protein